MSNTDNSWDDMTGDDNSLAVLLHGIVGWVNLIWPLIFVFASDWNGGGFDYWLSASNITNAILFPLIWFPVAVLWLLTLFLDSGFLAWLFQFWIVITWAGLFGAHWLGPLLALIGWLSDEAKGASHFFVQLAFAAGSSVFTIFFAGNAREEIKKWYDADDVPDSDFVDNVEDLGDDAEDNLDKEGEMDNDDDF